MPFGGSKTNDRTNSWRVALGFVKRHPSLTWAAISLALLLTAVLG